MNTMLATVAVRVDAASRSVGDGEALDVVVGGEEVGRAFAVGVAAALDVVGDTVIIAVGSWRGEGEWEAIAGGAAVDRYPWDPPQGPPTEEKRAVTWRANVREAELGGTSPVGMYPLGASRPFGLMDLAGNVWEWTASLWESDSSRRVLRGGSWGFDREYARCAVRLRDFPYFSFYRVGFRCVSPVS